MELSSHGTERILERTGMHIIEVLYILRLGAVVSLGSEGKSEFLLFYSPADNVSKIAVVSRDHSKLISIWNTDFLLPKTLSRITRQRETLAREKVAPLLATLRELIPRPLEIVAYVHIKNGKEILYQEAFGSLEWSRVSPKEKMLRQLQVKLERLCAHVESRIGVCKGVLYTIACFEPGSPAPVLRYLIPHKSLVSFLVSPPV